MTSVIVVFSPVLLVIDLVAIVFAIVTIVDMSRRPRWQWQQAGSNKTLWLVFEIIFLLIFSFISIIIGVIYFAVTRPKLIAVERQGGGPGGWPPAPPGYQPIPPQVPSSPYPPPRESSAGPPDQPESGPPAYPGGGPPPYPGDSGPVPPYPGSGQTPSYPTYPGPAPGFPQAPSYAPSPTSNPPFGWYPDPSGRHEKRYWDGTRWTEHVSDADQQSNDPLPG